MKWEYEYCHAGPLDLKEVFEIHGNDGWECFQIVYKPSTGDFASRYDMQLFFKRPVKSK
jgi:hypothetical protein